MGTGQKGSHQNWDPRKSDLIWGSSSFITTLSWFVKSSGDVRK